MWNTVEADAWSKGFSYNGYIEYRKALGHDGDGLCVTAYLTLCSALTAQMEYDSAEKRNHVNEKCL